MGKGMKISKETVSEKVPMKFVTVLAIISIVGFLQIASESLFNLDFSEYLASAWLIIMGGGFVLNTRPIDLFRQLRLMLTPNLFSRLTTFIVGFIAVLAGFITLPYFEISSLPILAVRGVISLVAIVFIIIETWVVRK